MVYHVGKMVLQQTQEVFQGKVNDVIVCQDMASAGKAYYTVLVVHNRDVAKRLLELFHGGRAQAKERFVADFTWKDAYLMVFDYVRERPLKDFFTSEIASLAECEELCLNLVVECMACGVPYPVLYLQLLQDQIHISKDKNVYLGYCIDLSQFMGRITERECATLCAQKIFPMLGEVSMGKNGKVSKATSYKLLEKRSWKSGYYRFTDLYKDLRMAAVPLKKDGIFLRIKRFFRHNQDRLFRILLVVCVLLGLLALLMILSQMIFSDVPFLRLFVNTFQQIGTESLLQ